MKDITKKLIGLLKENNCTPLISKIAKKLKEPSTTLHYNIKKLEKEGIIKAYKAVFDYKKIDEGFCCFVLINLSQEEYGQPDRVGKELAKYSEIESIDVCTGDWELVIKVRVKDQDEFYQFVKNVLSKKGIAKTKSLVSFRQLKTEFVEI